MRKIAIIIELILVVGAYTSSVSLDAVPYDYSVIDRHAINAPAKVTRSIPELTAYLVKPAKNDREKARAIFRWISKNITYHIEAYLGDVKGQSDAESVLKNRKGVCGGYARLFAAMAKEAGLNVKVISGLAKEKMKFDPSMPDLQGHAWNVIELDGKWQALDATGGGSSFWNEKTKHYEDILVNFYFLIPPDRLRYEYFPNDPEWQLMKPHIDKDEFNRLPQLIFGYWNHSIELLSPKTDIEATEDKVEIRLKGPGDLVMIGVVLKGDVILSRKASIDLNKMIQNSSFILKNGGLYTVKAVFPQKEVYYLIIVVKKKSDPDTLYQPVAIYRINVTKGSPMAYPQPTPLFYEEEITLLSPLESNFLSGRKVSFELKSKKALQVMVVQDNSNYVMLTKKGDLFKGEYTVPKGDFNVIAKFSDKEEFKPLLVYHGL
ncbi:MAG: hypothetical protein KA369_04155 [Spirochaetes bacterium]|nr:hypothetical protein [Spirochaetota bacterium]